MTNLRKLGAFIVLAALVFAFILGSASSAEAQARDANWVVAVTYQNIGDAPATLVVNFYEEGSSVPIPYDPLAGGTLAAGAGRSFFIGNVSGVDPGFTGNAVISSDQPLVSTVVQFSNDPGFKMRLLYNGFQASDADSIYFIATVLKNRLERTTVFSIQNTENEAINAKIDFYDADNVGAFAETVSHVIEPNSSKFIEMDDPADTNLTDVEYPQFNGSAVITAEKLSGGPANIVAAASEYYIDRNVAADFEGLPLARAAQTINMATGLCESFGLDSFYAVSNASTTTSTNITVFYKDKDGNDVAEDGPYHIAPGAKKSIRTCNPNDGTDMSGFTGSAVITSDAAPIVVIGKAQNSLNAGGPNTQDVFTAFLGEAGGSSERAIPFVRWANDAEYNDANNNGGKQRSFIAVQNLENSTTLVDAQYYDKNGVLVGTHTLTIPALSKGNTNASLAGVLGSPGMTAGSFGYYTDGTFGAGVILVANSANPGAEFIAINRTQNPGAGEDANAVPTQ